MFSRVQGPRKMMPCTQQSLDLQTINFHSWLQFYEILYPQQLFFLLKVINCFPSLQLVYAVHISQAISIRRREHNFPTVLGVSWSKIPARKMNFSFLNFVLPFSAFFSSKDIKGQLYKYTDFNSTTAVNPTINELNPNLPHQMSQVGCISHMCFMLLAGQMWASGLGHSSGGLHIFCLRGFSFLLVKMSIWICPCYLWHPERADTKGSTARHSAAEQNKPAFPLQKGCFGEDL